MTDELCAYFNGRLVPISDVKIPYGDSGFIYGYSVFDSSRTFGHRPFRLREHLARFYLSLRAVRIDPGLPADEMERITLEILAANECSLDSQADVWLTHSATGGQLLQNVGRWVCGAPTVIVTCSPINFGAYAHLYDSGVHAVTPSTRHIPQQCVDPRIKHRSRLSFVLAEFEVNEVDPEAFSILQDVHGNLTENKGGNFFIVTDGVVRTPPTAHVLAGVSRATVIELAQQAGIPVIEETLRPYHVMTADEAFFCSTSYCLMPATRFNGTPVGDGAPGPVTTQLLAAWSELVGSDIVGQAKRCAALEHSTRT